MKISMLLLQTLTTTSMIMISVDGLMDNTPTCFDSCSNQVSCSISQYISLCRAEPETDAADGPDISGEPVDLQVVKLHDKEHQYVHLSWRPPRDGSYNYLRGYLVQVTVISADYAHSDVTDTVCYKILPASTWLETHRRLSHAGGVTFYLNCIRTPATASLDIIISVHSLPLRADAPKLANTTVSIRPEASNRGWNPQLRRWLDDRQVMHLIIENPLKEAHFYDVQIQSARTGHVVFSHVFQILLGNRSQDKFSVVDQNGKPHFLLRGLSTVDNYTILMDVLDENKTHIPNFQSIETIPFSLNFSRQLETVSATATRAMTPNHVIIVCVTAAALAVVCACLAVRGLLKSSPLRCLARGTTYQPVKLRLINRPAFVPVYCHESDNFVGAVRSHVILLRRCIDVLTESHGSRACVFPVCGSTGSGRTRAKSDSKHCDAIVYLSPRLKQILRHGPQSVDLFSTLDAQCLEALKTLRTRCLAEKDELIHLVTFDCFQKAEMTFMDDLTSWLYPRQRDLDMDPLSPMSLTKYGSSGWRLENLEQVLLRLFRLREFSADMARSLEGWEESSEAKEVGRYFDLLSESNILDNFCTVSTIDQDRSSVVVEADCAHYCSRVRLGMDKVRLTNPEHFYKSPEKCPDEENQHVMNLHTETLLRLQAKGHNSEPDSDTRKSCQLRLNLNHSSLDPSPQSHSQAQLSESVMTHLHSFSQRSLDTPSKTSSLECHLLVLPGLKYPHATNKQASDTRMPELANFHTKCITDSSNRAHPSKDENVLADSKLSVNVKGQDKNVNGFLRKDIDDDEEEALFDGYCDLRGGYNVVPPSLSYSSCALMGDRYNVVPPSLSYSSFASMGSVCERINKINERSCWSVSSLSQ